MLDDLVFVGGLQNRPPRYRRRKGDPRATRDVDAIAAISSYAAYTAFGDRLCSLGFAEDTSEGAPLCRRVHQEVVLDVMPLNEEI